MNDRDENVTPATRADKRVVLRRYPFGPPGPWTRFAGYHGAMRLWIGAVLEREIEDGRGFLWLPAAFGLGVILYFALPQEPAFLALALLAATFVVAGVSFRRRAALFRVLVLAATVAAGMTAMKLRTDAVEAPRLKREITATVTGWVAEESETARGGARIHLRVRSIDKLAAAETPSIVRVTIRSRTSAFAVGDAITLKARLQPPGGPVLPGGYDFGRAAFYEGIGAVGFAYGAARPAALGAAPWDVRARRPLEELRDTIRIRIEEALPGDNGRIAAALIMGDQGGISKKTQDAMRASGLGHVLSISGLHMALIAGSAFWLIRALLALSPALALGYPIKKWAAAGGLAVAAFYLGISGGGVATDRAFVMLAVMLVAVLVDRRALTLRNVALAAFAILVFAPEAMLTASFQMSFAATVALVSAYEVIARRADRRAVLADKAGFGLAGRIWRSVAGLAVTSLIAGLATAPFAAFHFQRTAPLSLLANLAAMPAIGILVMPMALCAVLLMPFGLEVLPLRVMDWGLDWMMLVAERTAAWSAGAGNIRAAPVLTLILVVIGFLWLTLWRERWRLAGILPMLAAIPLALLAPRPDILIDDSGTAIAVRGDDGRLHIAGGKDAAFVVENWLRADADPRDARSEGLDAGVHCDPVGCIAPLAGGGTVALVLKPDAFAEDCLAATVVVSRFEAPPGCAAETLVVDRDALARFGAHALYREKKQPSTGPPQSGFRVETAYPAIHRPYMPWVAPAVSVNSGG